MPAGGSWMGWVLQLVETGADNRAQSIDVMEISRPSDLRDIASLGLTLSEAKQLLARVQQAVVAAQARDHAGLRPDCAACGGRCPAKDWRPHRIAKAFGGDRDSTRLKSSHPHISHALFSLKKKK